MFLHKNAKIAKIVEEINHYFLDRGYKKISVLLETEKSKTIIKVHVYTDNKKIVDEFKEDIFCCRDVELEEYGWELMGESDQICRLNTLGTLVDRYEINYLDSVCEIVFYRNEE